MRNVIRNYSINIEEAQPHEKEYNPDSEGENRGRTRIIGTIAPRNAEVGGRIELL